MLTGTPRAGGWQQRQQARFAGLAQFLFNGGNGGVEDASSVATLRSNGQASRRDQTANEEYKMGMGNGERAHRYDHGVGHALQPHTVAAHEYWYLVC